jgi:hypothetical protein
LADEPGRLADPMKNALGAQKLRKIAGARFAFHDRNDGLRSESILRERARSLRERGMRKAGLILAALLSLPILLFVYQPSLQLGVWAFVLGNIGRTLSPLILFGALAYVISKEWNK